MTLVPNIYTTCMTDRKKSRLASQAYSALGHPLLQSDPSIYSKKFAATGFHCKNCDGCCCCADDKKTENAFDLPGFLLACHFATPFYLQNYG